MVPFQIYVNVQSTSFMQACRSIKAQFFILELSMKSMTLFLLPVTQLLVFTQ